MALALISFSRLRLCCSPLRHPSRALSTTLGLRSQHDNAAQDKNKNKSLVFFDDRVQAELKRQTGVDMAKIFKGRGVTQSESRYVTTSELEELQRQALQDAERRLQMPPVMDQRKEEEQRVLDKDPALIGYDIQKLVFTDITYGVHDRDRMIVVREPDGTLREASWDERDRMNQVYNPREGRKMDQPPMFEPEKLQEILRPDRYEYVLDRNCVQFEPDHPVFIRTAEAVYNHIDQEGHYDSLLSTRHFGPLVFHLAWEKRVDDLMIHYLQKGRMESVQSLVKVYALVHPESGAARASDLGEMERLRIYIKDDSNKSSKVHICLESALEKIAQAVEASKSLKDAHGVAKEQ